MTFGQWSPKPKQCAAPKCGRDFMPARPLQAVCGPLCAARKARSESAAKRAAERTQTRARKEAIKTIPDLIRETQVVFNTYIRARDAGKPCICCGRSGGGEAHTGGKWDAGHYRSVGSAPHLRFDERNVHRQLKDCNRWGAGRAVDYRIGLIARIGVQQVEALESDNRVHKWTAEELRAIRDLYRARVKESKQPGSRA